MTKDLEQDLHNIFSAIFSGRKCDKGFTEDFRVVINILNKYSEVLKSKYRDSIFIDKKIVGIINNVIKSNKSLFLEDINETCITFKMNKDNSWISTSKSLESLNENSVNEIIESLTKQIEFNNESST